LGGARAADWSATACALLDFYQHDVSQFHRAREDAGTLSEAARRARVCQDMTCRLRIADRHISVLPESAFIPLRARELASLPLAPLLGLPGEVNANSDSLLPFPQVTHVHTEGCPFSADVLPSGPNALTCVALSVPPVVRMDEHTCTLPRLSGERPPGRRPHVRASRYATLLGWHTFLLLPIPAIWAWRAHAISTNLFVTHPWVAATDPFVTWLGTAVLAGGYGRFVRMRYRMSRVRRRQLR
jgi:hypothetical protein